MSRPQRWHFAVRALHWAGAALILGQLALGAAMARIVTDTGWRFDLYQLHKPLGLIALALTLLRLGARAATLAPDPPPHSPVWQRRAAAAAHAALYALALLLPLSGWVMVSASPLPIPISAFGLFDMPMLIKPSLEVYYAAKSAHSLIAGGLFALMALHAAAALKHHFHDVDGVLLRMWR